MIENWRQRAPRHNNGGWIAEEEIPRHTVGMVSRKNDTSAAWKIMERVVAVKEEANQQGYGLFTALGGVNFAADDRPAHDSAERDTEYRAQRIPLRAKLTLGEHEPDCRRNEGGLSCDS